MESKVYAPRLVIYGTGGIGKSTWCKWCPAPYFLSIEDGLRNIRNIEATEFFDYTSFVTKLEDMRNHPENYAKYKTIVIDSLDWLERKLIYPEVCRNNKVDSIEKLSYGKGYAMAADLWTVILDMLNDINTQGKIIACISHDAVTTYNDPDTGEVRKFDLKLHKTAKAMISEWADAVFFLTRKLGARKGNISPRVLKTADSCSHFAKSRYNVPEIIEDIHPLNVIKMICDDQMREEDECPF